MERKTTKHFFFLIVLGFILGISSCYYDNEELLYSNAPCDTTSTFSSRIAPLVQQKCATGCHEGANPSASLLLTTYDEIKACVDNNNKFANSLTGANGASIMPKGTSGLSTCDKTASQAWISAGALNN